jgi:pilus assembly protein CpaC
VNPLGPPVFFRAKLFWAIPLLAVAHAVAQPVPAPPAAASLTVTVSKSLVLDSPANIERVSVANGDMAEAVVINPREVMVNGKAPGDTSLIIWQQGGRRTAYDLTVRPSTAALDAVRQELQDQLPDQQISVDLQSNTVFLKGTANSLFVADRAAAIAGVLGRVVNLLNVTVPPTSPQILLKVRFVDVDRSATVQLGANIASLGATNTVGTVSTGQYSPPTITTPPTGPATMTLTNALNVFLFRRDLNLAATIQALEGKNLLQILAEPNVLTIDGQPASFLAGGEFPYPTLQGGGAGLGAVTIAFREFGVRINFTPKLTPRGTIRLDVQPEVSSLDYANGLIFQGFTIPGLDTRRIHTQIELEEGQSFAIAGLLDQRTTDTLSKIPGLGDIPLLGKLFQSRNLNKSRSELLVLVTPEIVRPIPAGMPLPDLSRSMPFLPGAPPTAPQTPGIEITGPVPGRPSQAAIPIEQLIDSQKPLPAANSQQNQPGTQFLPIPVMAVPSGPATPAAPAAPAAPGPASPGAGGPPAN